MTVDASNLAFLKAFWAPVHIFAENNARKEYRSGNIKNISSKEFQRVSGGLPSKDLQGIGCILLIMWIMTHAGLELKSF